MSKMHSQPQGGAVLPLDTKPWTSRVLRGWAHWKVAPLQQHEPQTWDVPALPAFSGWVGPGVTLTSPRAAGRTLWPCQKPRSSERGRVPPAGRTPGEDTAPGPGAGPHCLLPLVFRAGTNLHVSGLGCHLTPDYHQQPLGTHMAAVAKGRTGLNSGVSHLKITHLAHFTVTTGTEPRLIRRLRVSKLLTLTLTPTF